MNKNRNIQPTFLLKINPTSLYTKYKSGFFNRPIQNKTLIKIVQANVRLSTLSQEINHKVIVSGEKNVEIFTKNGNKMPQGGRCHGCYKDFTHAQVGYPLAYECKHVIDENCYQSVHVFWVEGCFHSYGCCLRYLRKINKSVKDNLMIDTEIMLKFMYHLEYNTDEPLKEDNDPLLLIDNGGCLTQEKKKKNTYTRTNNIIKIPAQVVYSKV